MIGFKYSINQLHDIKVDLQGPQPALPDILHHLHLLRRLLDLLQTAVARSRLSLSLMYPVINISIRIVAPPPAFQKMFCHPTMCIFWPSFLPGRPPVKEKKFH
jgi:hypothetical protein